MADENPEADERVSYEEMGLDDRILKVNFAQFFPVDLNFTYIHKILLI